MVRLDVDEVNTATTIASYGDDGVLHDVLSCVRAFLTLTLGVRFAIEVDGVSSANDRRGRQATGTSRSGWRARVDARDELEPAHA
jgi:hypothetical protein